MKSEKQTMQRGNIKLHCKQECNFVYRPFLQKMKVLYPCLILFYVATKEVAESKCFAADEKHIECQIPKDNNTQKTVALMFLPDERSEELLVECVWIGSQFHCITQKGFELRGPVSESAVITIPTNISEKRGSYRCITENNTLDTIIPCRFLDRQAQTSSTVDLRVILPIVCVILLVPAALGLLLLIRRQSRIRRYQQAQQLNLTDAHPQLQPSNMNSSAEPLV